tara:strand:- start:513 stop:824 length:312 start_codon:yes stop_codon:yes gene_type:complete
MGLNSLLSGVSLSGRQLGLSIALIASISSALTAPVYLHMRGELERSDRECDERFDRVDTERKELADRALEKAEMCAEQRIEQLEACILLREMGSALLPRTEEE